MTEIAAKPLPRPKAAIKIQEIARQIPKTDGDKYIEAVKTELLTLHEGNFARYWTSPTQCRQWEKLWKM